MSYLEPRKRIALDGRVWYCIYNTKTHKWSVNPWHGKYSRKKDAQYAIDRYMKGENKYA